jgi:dethiobiotin synthetase
MTREHRLVIAGTGTEIGKTWVAVRLLQHARTLGLRVAARKPAQSYAQGEGPTDAELLAAASNEDPHIVCPPHRWYPIPMAPPMAADALGLGRIKIEQLVLESAWPLNVELAVIETAGGLCSPIAHDADNLALIEKLAPTRVVLVADAGLGTLNAVRLCLRALDGQPTTVFLNRFDGINELHVRNREWLMNEAVRVETDVASLMDAVTR